MPDGKRERAQRRRPTGNSGVGSHKDDAADGKRVRGDISQKYLKTRVEWTIHHIFRDAAINSCYESPRFSIPGSEWFLRMYPNGQTVHDSVGWIGLYITWASDDSVPPIHVDYDLGVKKVDGEVEVIRRYSTVFDKGNKGRGTDKFLQRRKLCERRSVLAPAGSLTITCTVKVKEASHCASRLNELSENYKDMFLSSKCCDAILNVQNQEFPVHKSVLSSRSPVLQSMFEVDMKEKNTGTVDIVDCDPKVFRDFLVYIYSGQFQVSSGDACELYKIAHKYCTEGLKSACVQFMSSNVSVDNVLKIAILGDQFDENELKVKSQDFFDENFFSVVATDEWIHLLEQKRTLANQLINNAKKSTETKKTVDRKGEFSDTGIAAWGRGYAAMTSGGVV